MILRTPAHKAHCLETIANLSPGKVWEVEVREYKSTRTIEQNNKMWAMLGEVSAQVDWYGNKLTDEEWKDVFTAALKKQKAVPGLDGGFVVIGARTSKMKIAEMVELIELMYAFGAERGVNFGEYA